ncbi:MAG: HAD family phosphatase [Sphingobium sp.]
MTTRAPRETCFCFDLDGTITGEELLPLIASEVGLEEEMRLLTRITMDGLIPFEDSFRLRFAILRSASVERIQQIVAEVRVDPDVEGFIGENRDRCFIVTGNLDVWIAPLIERLGCHVYSSTSRADREGRIELVDIMRKNVPALALKERFGRVVAVGDGYNDVPMFDVADVGVAFNGVHPSPDALVSVADYVALNGKGLCRLLNTL